MKNVPHIMSEFDTMRLAVTGMGLSRYGDGELRLATNGSAVSQRTRDEQLIGELRVILDGRVNPPNLLVCLPDFGAYGPRREAWQKYASNEYRALFGKQRYGSAFVTRPDNAPWINTPPYWDLVRDLWRGKDVCLVTGNEKSLTPDVMKEANSVRVVYGPAVEAYVEIDRIEAEVGDHRDGPVILCLGATATVLAWRLARKGMHACDLGHLGMFMKRMASAPVADAGVM